MALKAEGAALDCFEVTLKCEEGDDDEEAMVVAVIPRPEPMLRGEDGRGSHFRVTLGGLGSPRLPPHTFGARAPPPPPARGPQRPLPPLVRGASALLLRPPQGLESQAFPNSPSPAPAQGLEPSIQAPRAPDLPVPERPLSRAQQERPDSRRRWVSAAARSRPAEAEAEAGPGAAGPPDRGWRGSLASGAVRGMEAGAAAARREVDRKGPPCRKLSFPPRVHPQAFDLRKPQVSDPGAPREDGIAYTTRCGKRSAC